MNSTSTSSVPLHSQIDFCLFGMTDPKDCSDHLGTTGLFASGSFPHMTYNMCSSILKAEQIARASKEAELTNISLPENESVLELRTILIIANKYTQLYCPQIVVKCV